MLFDRKNQENWFEFVFWQRKSIWSIFTGYLLYFFKSNLLFDWKNQENVFEFCVLTGRIKEIHLHLCFDRNFCFDVKIQTNLFEFVFWQRKSMWSIFTGYLQKIKKMYLNFVFWQVKSNTFICIFVLTRKIQQNDLHFCFDVKIQTNLLEFVF